MHAAAAGPLLELDQPPGVTVAGDQLAAVLHLRRQRERLAPGPGTRVHHDLSRPRAAGLGDELAALVLHLEESRLERLEREHVGAAHEGQRVRRPAGRLDPGALRFEHGAQLVAAVLEQIRAHRERSAPVQRRRQRAGFPGTELLVPELRQPSRQRGLGGKRVERIVRNAEALRVGDQLERPAPCCDLGTGEPRGALWGLPLAHDEIRRVPEQVLGGRRQLFERQLARAEGALQEVVDAPLQTQEPIHRVGHRTPLHAAKQLLAPQNALERLVRTRALAADFLVDLQHRSADELRSHGAASRMATHMLSTGKSACRRTDVRRNSPRRRYR